MTTAHNPNGPFYFDELHVGQLFTSGTHRVDEAQITAFAGAFDTQPFHLDDKAARETLFGGLAASGWHTAALTMKLLTEYPYFVGGMIGSGVRISWPRPTRPGDILHVDSEIIEITGSRTHPDRGRVILRSETRNQRNEIVQVMTARIVVPMRPAAAND